MAEEFDPIEEVLDRAMGYASERNHEYVVLEHLLLSLMEEKDIQNLISEIGGETDEIMHDCMAYIENQLNDIVIESEEAPRKTSALERVFNRCFTSVLFLGKDVNSILKINF